MFRLQRTQTCGALRGTDVEKTVTLNGWVDSRRDHGNLIFIDLRDRYGKTQIVFAHDRNAGVHSQAGTLKPEYVIAVKGIVRRRTESAVNKALPTGEVEVEAHELEILNESKTTPFEILDELNVSDELRLKHRYLDLRRPAMQRNFIVRHRMVQAIREYCDTHGFIEIETPYMIKNTPGGARNFLIPSRIFPGQFFALAESPQIFKQLFMVSGFDRYFQIARCFRDEDLRADRQLEFTQLDLEMSFVKEHDVMTVIEGCMAAVFKKVCSVDVTLPFRRIPYHEAMARFGSDKPDLRYGMELFGVTDLVRNSAFRVFKEGIAAGSVVLGLNVSGAGKYSRKDIDELTVFVQGLGAKGLLWMKVEADGAWSSPTAKFMTPEEITRINGISGAKPGDLLFFVVDKQEKAQTILGALRGHLAQKLELIPKNTYSFCWVVDFPLFEWNEQDQKLQARHHAFTSPKDEDLEILEKEPSRVKAKAYDLVLNGVELGGGSIRIHRRDVQQRIFRLLGIPDESAREKFSFLLEAFEYGAPPHGGIALGLDRMAMLILELDSIRDVLAFPKTQRTVCLMQGAPSAVDEKHLKEVHIKPVVE